METDSSTIRRYIARFVLIATLLVPTAAAGADAHTVRIGVLAKRGVAQCSQKWGPTAGYLSRTVSPHKFEVIPLDFAAVPHAVAQKSVDFILTNSSSYVELEEQYHIHAIATLVNRLHCGDHKVFGGVVFCRSDDPDIYKFEDLRGKDFIAVEKTSFGGWRMALREFLQDGINPHTDFKSLSFAGTHDAVVYAVQRGRADAGTVRTDTLERMSAEGKIDLASFRVLLSSAADNHDFAYRCSTRLYPEWPMAKLAHTPVRLSEQVAQALFHMPADDPAAKAAKCAGWCYPLSYHSIQESLQEIKSSLDDPNALQSLGVIYRRHKLLLGAAGIIWGAVMISALFIIRLNTRMSLANADLKVEINKRKQTEKALEAALEASQAANIAKTQFLANMSHELRTPMNGIIGMTGILLDSPLNEDQLDFARTIKNSARGLLRLINDILDFSNIEKGKFSLKMVDFELPNAIDGITKAFQGHAAEKGLALSHMVDEHVPVYLKGDADRLKQVIENLLDNAVKFTCQGGVLVHVALDSIQQNHCMLRISIRDTGIGIPPEGIGRIFSSFSQLDGSYTRKFGGSGLGLALAKHLVEMMGGQISVQSAPEKGSTFCFTVRLEMLKTSSKLQSFHDNDIIGKRILVVDDSPIDRIILENMLKTWDVPNASAANAQGAITLMHQGAADNNAFDLAIIDRHMPGMNGDELGRAVKDDPALQKIKLVMCTSDVRPLDLNQIKDAGFDAYLTKPVEPGQLLDCLRLVLSPSPKPSPGTNSSPSLITKNEIEQAQSHAPNILVVEDNIVNQKVIMKMLAARGYRVQVSDNGRKAVEELCRCNYDVVLMDLQMPEMNGFEATAAIRNPQNGCLDPEVPIIAVTANTGDEDRRQCLESGMNDYLPKPVTPKKLIEIIQHWHDRRRISINSDVRGLIRNPKHLFTSNK